jgi:hypothetical protein
VVGVGVIPWAPRQRPHRGLQGAKPAQLLLLLLLVWLGQHLPVLLLLLLVKGQRHAVLCCRVHLAGAWGQQGA